MSKIIISSAKAIKGRTLPLGYGVELHMGGADGKQPHPDGSPQSVHGKKGSGGIVSKSIVSKKETSGGAEDIKWGVGDLPYSPFGDYGETNEGKIVAFRGDNDTGIGFGSTEGNGMYLARDISTAEFFSSTGKVEKVTFEPPKKPFVIANEELYLLSEGDLLEEPLAPSDTAWGRLCKISYQEALAVFGKHDIDAASKILTKNLMSKGYDSVLVYSGAESWTVLFNPKVIKTSKIKG